MVTKKETALLPKNVGYISVLDGTLAYGELRQNIIKQGILKRAYSYYGIMAFITLVGFAVSVYGIFVTPISITLVGWCLLMAFFTVHIGGLIHDAAHRAITTSTKTNDIIGFILSAIIATGYGHWMTSHNKHHAHTNQEGQDPDLELPLHSFTKNRYLRQKGVMKFLSKYQAYLYFPIRSFSVYKQRLNAIKYFEHQKRMTVIWEIIVWAIGLGIWYALPFLFFPWVKALLVILIVNNVSGFYFANIFAPNHKGMPELAEDAKISFLEHQIMTSRNIYGNWLTDYIFMGLNYQIEHHLFPNCPRNKLKDITPFIRQICRKMNLEYTQVGIIESNKIILSQLQQIALTA